jgi:hypothetical protein
MEWETQDHDGGMHAWDGQFHWSVWQGPSGKWLSTTNARGGSVWLGLFDEIELAIDAAEALSAAWKYLDEQGIDPV